MAHTPHELSEEFPEYKEQIHELKMNDAHFERLVDAYHKVNRAIHRAETFVEPVDELTEQTMRKQRMALKDDIWGRLQVAD